MQVGISVDGEEGPGSYGLNRNVELTFVLAKENKVVANFAFVQSSVTDAPVISASRAAIAVVPDFWLPRMSNGSGFTLAPIDCIPSTIPLMARRIADGLARRDASDVVCFVMDFLYGIAPRIAGRLLELSYHFENVGHGPATVR